MAWTDKGIEPSTPIEPQTFDQLLDTLRNLGIATQVEGLFEKTLYRFDREAFDAQVRNFNFVLKGK